MQLVQVFVVSVAIFAVFLGVVYKIITTPPVMIELNPKQYWGPGNEPATLDTSIRNFKIKVSRKDLHDLKWRLDNLIPLVPLLEGIQQQYGMNTRLLTKIVKFWKTKYNWTDRKAYLNQFPQFKTNIQGLDIHYLHVKPKNSGNKKVYPLLIIHGWPGSVREFYGPPYPWIWIFPGGRQAGFRRQSNRSHYEQFNEKRGDFGAVILQNLSVIYPVSVLGYHTNMAIINTLWSFIKYFLGTLYPSWVVRSEHYDRVYPLWEKFEWRLKETGYLYIQAAKPDTVGVVVTDSPAGLAAYILEKFTTLTDKIWQEREDGGLLEKFTYTDLLDNIMIYWVTRSTTTSFRLYAETVNKSQKEQNIINQPLQVPTAIARFRNDVYVADGIIGEIFPNNIQLSDFEGGHFAAMELPDVMAEDLFSAVDKFVEYNLKNGRIHKK